MWNNYFKIAFRQLFRNKLFSFINIGGLAIAMMSSLFLFQYIYFEKSYDNFHDKKDRIYRVTLKQSKHGESIFAAAANYLPVGANLKADYQEISDQTRMYYVDGHSFLKRAHEILDLEHVAFVDTYCLGCHPIGIFSVYLSSRCGRCFLLLYGAYCLSCHSTGVRSQCSGFVAYCVSGYSPGIIVTGDLTSDCDLCVSILGNAYCLSCHSTGICLGFRCLLCGLSPTRYHVCEFKRSRTQN